jgi:hypothetical protein
MTVIVAKPRVHRVPAEYMGGYTFTLTRYGEPWKYMVRRDIAHPAWGWNVYRIHHEDKYRWVLVIDQMSSMDYALRTAVADSWSTGARFLTGSDIEWGNAE